MCGWCGCQSSHPPRCCLQSCYLHRLHLLTTLNCVQSWMMLGTMNFPAKQKMIIKNWTLSLTTFLYPQQHYLFWTRDVTSIRQNETAEFIEVLYSPLFPLWGLQQHLCKKLKVIQTSTQSIQYNITKYSPEAPFCTSIMNLVEKKEEEYKSQVNQCCLHSFSHRISKKALAI